MGQYDVYEIVAKQSYKGQDVVNVYHYQQSEIILSLGGTTAQFLLNRWRDTILPAIAACQDGALVYTELTCRNLFNSGDKGSILLSLAGGWGEQDSLPTFNAVNFDMAGDNPAVRNGSKRLAGVLELSQSDGVLTHPESLNRYTAAAAAMAQSLIISPLGIVPEFFPVTVKRVRTGTPGAYKYELPETVQESVLSRIVSVLFDVLISSQISRKIGVGR